MTVVFLIPLFPHYAMSSYETAVVRVQKIVRQLAPQMKRHRAAAVFDAPEYIAALAGSAKDYLGTGFDHLLFSFHGVPERQIKKSDPTRRHCLTAKDCCQTRQPGAPVLLPSPVFPHGGGICEGGENSGGQIFRRVPVAAGPGSVADAAHGQ